MLNTLRYFSWPLATGLLVALLVLKTAPQLIGLPEIDMSMGLLNTQAPVSYAQAVQKAAPAVANLYTTKRVNAKGRRPDSPLYRHYFEDGGAAQKRIESSLGSAVIMHTDGYLLTNHHVIADAEQIVVSLYDGRETIGRLIGTDPETDLAVLKIDLENLTSITLGQNERLRIGDVALAIGNPLGVGQTVTMGIVSATGRNQLGLSTYEDFIQTDAAINMGNSGGALVDAHGHLIGINTAILSGGSQGIGFSIPANLAVEVMQSILSQGRVIRGWMGLEVQPLTQELAESFGIDAHTGVVVAAVYRNGPADKAGIQSGDLIISIDGISAHDGRSAMNQVARARPGDVVAIEVLRDGKPLTLQTIIGVRPPPSKQ